MDVILLMNGCAGRRTLPNDIECPMPKLEAKPLACQLLVLLIFGMPWNLGSLACAVNVVDSATCVDRACPSAAPSAVVAAAPAAWTPSGTDVGAAIDAATEDVVVLLAAGPVFAVICATAAEWTPVGIPLTGADEPDALAAGGDNGAEGAEDLEILMSFAGVASLSPSLSTACSCGCVGSDWLLRLRFLSSRRWSMRSKCCCR